MNAANKLYDALKFVDHLHFTERQLLQLRGGRNYFILAVTVVEEVEGRESPKIVSDESSGGLLVEDSFLAERQEDQISPSDF